MLRNIVSRQLSNPTTQRTSKDEKEKNAASGFFKKYLSDYS